MTISFGYILHDVCFNLHCVGFILFCNVCVCIYCTLTEVFLNLTEVFLTLNEVFLTLTEDFPCFFPSCKANARVKLANMGHGTHPSTLVVICVVRLLFVLFCVLSVCKCALPSGNNPIAHNKYIITMSLHH